MQAHRKTKSKFTLISGLILSCLLLATGIAQAQVIPITDGLIWHLDASAITGIADGEEVATWPDTSGAAPDGTCTTGVGALPTYKASAIGNKPAVSFNGAETLDYGDISGLTANTILMVYNARSYTGDDITYFGPVSWENGNCYIATYTGGTMTYYNNGESAVSQTGLSPNTPYLVAIRDDGVNMQSAINGGVPAVTNISGNLDNKFGPGSIGGWDITNYGTAYCIDADIAELILFNRALSDAEINEIGFYLEEKYLLETGYVGAGEPKLELNKELIRFPAAPPGDPVMTETFTVGNGGDADLVIADIDVAAIGSFNIDSVVLDGTQTIDAPYNVTVNPGGSLVVTVSSNPATLGIYTGALTINSNDSFSPNKQIDIEAIVAQSGLTIDGLIWHLDASTIEGVANGGAVNVWYDIAGAGPDGTAIKSGDPAPTYKAAAIGGKPAVSFNNAESLAYGDISGITSNSIFIVYNCRDYSENDDNFFGPTFWEAGSSYVIISDGGVNYYSNSGGEANVTVTDFDTNAPHLYSVRDDGLTAQVAIDGGEPVVSNITTNLVNYFGPGHIGAWQSASFLDADIAEILLFDRALTPGEENDIGYYLEQKYGLTTTYGPPAPIEGISATLLDFGWVAADAGIQTKEFMVSNVGSKGTDLDVLVGPVIIPTAPPTLSTVFTIQSVVRSVDPQPVPDQGYYSTTLGTTNTLIVTIAFDPTKTPIGTEQIWINSTPINIYGKVGTPSLPPVTNGLTLHLAADNITALNAGDPTVHSWSDTSGNENHALKAFGAPSIVNNGLNNLPIVKFDSSDESDGDTIVFNQVNDIRAAFVVLKEYDWTDEKYAPILGTVSDEPAFHRGDARAIRASQGWGGASVRDGLCWVNGAAVDMTATPIPTEFSIVAFSTAGNAFAGQIGLDRDYISGDDIRFFDGEYAEIILYDRVLMAPEMNRVGYYLQAKYGLTGGTYTEPVAGPNIYPDTPGITFRASLVGAPIKTEVLRIRDVGFGATPLDISRISLAGSDFSIVSVNLNDSLYLAPPYEATLSGDAADYLDVTISFDPATLGTKTDTLSIESNDPDTPILAVPLSALVEAPLDPHDWANQAVGGPALPGTAVFAPNATAPDTITVTGAGNDIEGNGDQFHYAYNTLSGNGMITARVVSHEGDTHDWMKAGVMIRETLDGNSPHAFVMITPEANAQSVMQWRTAAGGGSGDAGGRAAYLPLPYWLRVVRVGDTLTGYRSSDGVTWNTFPDSVNIPMKPNVLIGVAVTSHNVDELVDVVFDNISIEPLGSPPVLYVNGAATGAETGESWADAFPDIESAISKFASRGGGEIWVAGGVYELEAAITMQSNIHLLGGFNGTETEATQRDPWTNGTALVQNGANQRVIYADNITNMLIDGLILGCGNNPTEFWPTGGIALLDHMDDTSAIRNCAFIDGSVEGAEGAGGGLAFMNSNADGFTFENCVFAGNVAVDAGAGGIYLDETSVLFENCLVTGNYTGNMASAIASNLRNLQFHAEFINCTIAQNKAESAGAIITQGDPSNLILTNCIVANNTQAMAVMLPDPDGTSILTRDNCLLFGNDAPGALGNVLGADVTGDPSFKGIVATGTVASVTPNANGTVTVIALNGTLLAGLNLGGVLVNPDTSQPRQTIIIDHTDSSMTVIGDGFGATAGATFQALDYDLDASSAAIDTGADVLVINDFNNNTRRSGPAIDIGAYEYQYPPVDAPTGLDLAAADDSGAADDDNLTNVTTALTISGAAPTNATIAIKEGAAVLATGTTAQFTAGIDINLAEGAHSITATATDANQVESPASEPLTITIDATAPTPTLASTAPQSGPNPVIPVTVAFDEDVAGFDATDVTVGNGAISNFAAVDAQNYTFDVTAAAEGPVTVDIAAAAAQDAAGNASVAAAQLTREYSLGPNPTVVITSTAPSPTKATPIPITATFDQDVTGFEAADVTVSAGVTLGNFAAVSAKVYTFDLTVLDISTQLPVTVDIAADVAQNGAAKGNTAAAQFTITYDPGAAPSVILATTAPEPTPDALIPVTATFSEDMTGFEITDLIVGNGAASNFVAVSASLYTFDVTAAAIGAVTVDIPAGVAQNATLQDNAAANTLTRVYQPIVTVTLTLETPSNGVIAANPDQTTFNSGETVELTATADANFKFTGWTGDATGTDNPLNVTMDADKTIGASFAPVDQNALNITIEGQGAVAKNPDGNAFNPGTVVELTATAEAGWEFAGWSGDLTGTDNPTSVTMDADKNITATFTEITFTLTLETPTNGAITANPDQTTFPSGDTVELTATPDVGYKFTGWTGDADGTDNPLTVIMDVDKTIGANFVEEGTTVTRTLTIETAGDGTGSVTKNPDQTEFTDGATVELTAAAADGSVFAGWSGDEVSDQATITVTMDADKTITATFNLDPTTTPTHTLTLTAGDGGAVTPDGETTHDEGAEVTITATPADADTVFAGWEGDVTTGSEMTNPLVITMDADKTILATFKVLPAPADYKITWKKSTLVKTEVGEGQVSLALSVGSVKSSIKIQRLKKLPKKMTEKDGTTYILGLRLIPELSVTGAFGKITCDAEVEALTSDGAIKSITTKIANIALIDAASVATIKMTALRNDAAEVATTAIVTGAGADMKLTLNGVVLDSLATSQNCKYIKLASKAWKDKATKVKYVSLGGATGDITAAGAKSITAKGASIACDLIRVGQDITNLKAQSKKLNKIDYAATLGKPVGETLMQVLAPNIKTIFGTAAVNGVFVAGFDTGTNAATYSGAIKSIGTKAGAPTGEAHVSATAKAIKFKPSQGDFVVHTEPPVAGP